MEQTRKLNEQILDFTNLETITDTIAFQLLMNYNRNPKGLYYKPGDTIQIMKTVYTFQQHVFVRPSGKIKYGIRLEVVDSSRGLLGKGSFGLVYPIAYTVKLNFVYQTSQPTVMLSRRDKSNKTGNTRAIKIQSQHEYPKDYRRETQIAKVVGNLHVKDLRITPGYLAYTVMDCLPGESLTKVLSKPLTDQQRLELSLELLKALESQITSRKVIHMDVKPDNIMVDMNHNPPKVNFIDFGLSHMGDSKNYDTSGTPNYAAPEQLDSNDYARKTTDSYALATVIGQVWGLDSFNLDSLYNQKISKTFKQHKWISDKYLIAYPTHREVLNKTLDLLHQIKPESRLHVHEAISIFQLVDTLQNAPNPNYQSLNSTPEEIKQIEELIKSLNQETQGFFFNCGTSGKQNLKYEKIRGLQTLLLKMQLVDVTSAVIETVRDFPNIKQGLLSSRVSGLLNSLVENKVKTAENVQNRN